MFSTPGVQVCPAFLRSYMLDVNPVIVGLLRYALKDKQLSGVSVWRLTVTAYTCILSSRKADLRLGTGKSVLLRSIIKSLHKKYVKLPDAVAVTASTGIYTQLSILVD